MPTLPTTLSMVFNQIPYHSLPRLPLLTKFPHHRSITRTRRFSRVSPLSARRPREILEKTQTTVVAIASLDGSEDVHCPELIESDVDGAVGDF